MFHGKILNNVYWNASVKSQPVHTMNIHGIFPVYIP